MLCACFLNVSLKGELTSGFLDVFPVSLPKTILVGKGQTFASLTYRHWTFVKVFEEMYDSGKVAILLRLLVIFDPVANLKVAHC